MGEGEEVEVEEEEERRREREMSRVILCSSSAEEMLTDHTATSMLTQTATQPAFFLS